MIDDEIRLKRKKDLARDSRAGFDTTPVEDALLRQSNPGLKQKQLSPFFGDVGTTFSGPAREEIERDGDEGAGHLDDFLEQAERMVRAMKRDGLGHFGQFADPAKRREFVEALADRLRGGPGKPVASKEPEEAPFSSNAFWGDKDELQRVAKRVRPPRL